MINVPDERPACVTSLIKPFTIWNSTQGDVRFEKASSAAHVVGIMLAPWTCVTGSVLPGPPLPAAAVLPPGPHPPHQPQDGGRQNKGEPGHRARDGGSNGEELSQTTVTSCRFIWVTSCGLMCV